MTVFADKLKRIMTKRNISQAELSILTGIKPTTISGYVLEKYAPKQDALQKIAIALNIPESYFFSPDENISCNGNTEKIPVFSTKKITLRQAARVMHISEDILSERIRNGLYDFGEVYQNRNAKQLNYYISPKKFYEYTGWCYKEERGDIG